MPTGRRTLPTYQSFLAESSIRKSILGVSMAASRGKLLTQVDAALQRYDTECRNAHGYAVLGRKKVLLQQLLTQCQAWLNNPKKAGKDTPNHGVRRNAVAALAQAAWDEYKTQVFAERKANTRAAGAGPLTRMQPLYAKEKATFDRSKNTAISATTVKGALLDPQEGMGVDPADLEPKFRVDYSALSEDDLRDFIKKYGANIIAESGAPYVAYLSKGQRTQYALVVVENGIFYADFDQKFNTIDVRSKLSNDKDAATGKLIPLKLWEINLNRFVYAIDGYGNLFVMSPDATAAAVSGGDFGARQKQQSAGFQKQFSAASARINHSTFLAGKDVTCAGEIVIDQGTLVYLSNASGHYAPSAAALRLALDCFEGDGADLSGVIVGIATRDGITHKPASQLTSAG